jgi:hypothetical protein
MVQKMAPILTIFTDSCKQLSGFCETDVFVVDQPIAQIT